MRNFSMKKFGTPMRAGPGVASETVGLSSVGDPSVLRVGFASSTFFFVSLVIFSSSPVSDSAFGSRVLGSVCAGDSFLPSPPDLPPPLFPRAGARELSPLWSSLDSRGDS